MSINKYQIKKRIYSFLPYHIRTFLVFGSDISSLFEYLRLKKNKRYAYFQKYFYNKVANQGEYQQKQKFDTVVGSYDAHNHWKDYDNFLLKDLLKSSKDKIALDFGCGPGRNIIKYHHIFKRIDGVDIGEQVIEKCKQNLKFQKITEPKLYVNNGVDLSSITSNTYDVVLSTITLQHVCVYSTRINLFKEFYRVLRPGGVITIQMGYGAGSPDSVDYYADNYQALATNRGCDTRIESPDQLKSDLFKIGFKHFSYNIRPTGPGDFHPSWIYFRASK